MKLLPRGLIVIVSGALAACSLGGLMGGGAKPPTTLQTPPENTVYPD